MPDRDDLLTDARLYLCTDSRSRQGDFAEFVDAVMSGVFEASAGWVTGFILLFPLFFVRGLGGGDVKLVAALGAWLGPGDGLWLALYTAVVGGIIGIGYALVRGYLRTALTNLGVIGNHWMYSGFQAVPGITLENTERPRLPYAIPIFLGTMVTLWLH